jgi:hypothetical protein
MKRTSNPWLSFFLGCLFILASIVSLPGQPYIFKGDSLPPHPKENSWFHYKATQQVWAFSEGKWTLMSRLPVDSLYACGSMPMLKFYNFTYAISLDRTVWQIVDDHWCGEHLTVIHAEYLLKYYDLNMRLVAVGDTRGGEPLFQPMQVQGIDAFCAQLDPVRKTVVRDAYYVQWGILGTNGKWLINPIFDKPFRFVDGIAEVVYLGQKRKINMQGAFVDALGQRRQ